MAQQSSSSKAVHALAIPSEQEALQLEEITRQFRQHSQSIHRTGTASSQNAEYRITKLWRRHVSIAVPHEACRDHWGKSLGC